MTRDWSYLQPVELPGYPQGTPCPRCRCPVTHRRGPLYGNDTYCRGCHHVWVEGERMHRTTNLTDHEWRVILLETAAELRNRWPGVEIKTDRELTVRTGVCSGEIRLRPSGAPRDEAGMVPSAFMGGGTALSGDLSTVEAGLRDYRDALDVLHRAYAMIGHHRIWYGSTCFCDFCRGTGKESRGGRACTYCKGEGKRPSSVGQNGEEE